MGESGHPLWDLNQAPFGVLATEPETAKLLRTMPKRRRRTMRARYPDALEPALRELDEAIRSDRECGHLMKGHRP